MRGRTYLKNAAVLTFSGFALRILGMVFRVMIAGSLGGEGMGLYQLILALYAVFVSLASAGMNVASTRLAAQSLARGRGMAATMRGLCTAALGMGSISMVLQAVLAEPCARWLLHDARAELPLIVLAPSLPFIAVAGALRGCFLAQRHVRPNVISQMIEQLVRMAVAAAGLRVVAHWGAGYGCAAVLAGNTVSEVISCLLMAGFAAREPAFRSAPQEPLHPYTQQELWQIVLPVEGSRLLASGLQAAESSLIPYCLTLYLKDRTLAMAQYGNLKGMALPLLFFPFSILSALSSLLMPEITRAYTRGNQETVRRLILRMTALTAAFSALAGGGFLLFGSPLAMLVYHSEEVGRYVRILGAAAPFMYFESMVDGVLKGLGEQLATFRYSLLDSVLRIIGIWFLLPRCGMTGFLAVMIFSNLLTCTLNTVRMLRVTKKGLRKDAEQGKTAGYSV